MNPFDIFFAIVIGLTVAMGLWKGLIRQVFSLVGLLAGYLLAVNFYDQLAPAFSRLDSSLANIAAFMAIFVGVLVLAAFLGFLSARLISAAGLGWMNHAGGAAIGFLKGGLVIGIVALVLVTFLPPSNEMLRSSASLPLVLKGVVLAKSTLPKDMEQKFKDKLEKLDYLRQ